jgi:hypothetical protein
MVVVMVDGALHEDGRRDPQALCQGLVIFHAKGTGGQLRLRLRPAVAQPVRIEQVLVGIEERHHARQSGSSMQTCR